MDSAGREDRGVGDICGLYNAMTVGYLSSQSGAQRDLAWSSMGTGFNLEAEEWSPSGANGGIGAARL